MSKKKEITDKQLEKLREYAELEGSEIGDLVEALIELRESFSAYVLNNSFLSALNKELLEHLDNFETNTEITEEVFTPLPQIVKTLNWL